MGTIRLEYVPIQKYFLGLFGLDHLQLVYQDETDVLDSQDYWYVLEGVQDGVGVGGTLGALGETGRTSLSVANGASRDELVAKIGTPEDRGSRILATGPDLINTWLRMADYAAEIENQRLPYVAATLPFSATPSINSNSFIASLLWSVGIDISNVLPFGVRLTPGAATLLGTTGNDDYVADANFSQVVTGLGDDKLTGTGFASQRDKLYGGEGNDTFFWTDGENLYHGGQPRLDYVSDGTDTVDYSGVGEVHISASPYPVEHKVANYDAVFATGHDQLFSIEQISWNETNDVVIAGEGVELIEKPLELNLQGKSGGRGNELRLGDSHVGLIINSVNDTYTSVQTAANAGQDAGYWAQSVDWLAGSNADDLIYSGPNVLGIEGGDGNDAVDARLATPFSNQSPMSYDVELDGGRGDDTLVSNAGRTLARGGDGHDTFVLSAMSSGAGTVEFVIEDADANDRLFVPYAFFKIDRGGYEGSQLFQLSGAAFKITDTYSESFFEWSTDLSDQVHGNIDFVGSISYMLDGRDLIIKLLQGHAEDYQVDYGPGEPLGPHTTINVGELITETHIRVKDWSDGDLGLSFPIEFDSAVFDQTPNYYDYPGLRDVINSATASSRFIDPLAERPDGYLPQDIAATDQTSQVAARTFSAASPPQTTGTDHDDVLSAVTGGPYHFEGFGGNDDITGSSGGDTLDGGTGADVMRGGRGNDTYFVDNAGDTVIELDREGFDRVISSIDYRLGDNVENLALRGTAITGTGNAARNTIEGNDRNNTLIGGAGNDTLAGNLGDDILQGGTGSDGYVYEKGDGRDTIVEVTGDTAAHDVLVLAGGLTPADIMLLIDPAFANDLTFSFDDGGSVTVKDYFAGSGAGIEGVTFSAAALTWSQSDLATFAAAAIVTSNHAPVANNDAYAIAATESVPLPIAALLDNDSDRDGDTLSVTAITNILGGTAVLDGNGHVIVTRSGGSSNQSVSFDYTISDGHGGTSKASFQLGFIAGTANTPPQILSSTIAAVTEDQTSSGALVVFDANGDPLVFQLKTGGEPAKGVVAVNLDGTFTYTPNHDANGADQFTLTVTDGKSTPIAQTFDIVIAAVNDAPVARGDTGYAVESGQSVTISSAAVLANDSDVDGDTLSIASVSRAIGGTVAKDANGDIIFTAAVGFTGTASFDYTADDGHGSSAVATVGVHVTPNMPNARPVIVSVTLASVVEDHAALGRVIATDADGDDLTYALARGGAPEKGSVALRTDGSFTYTPNANANGPDHFTVSVSDGHSAAVEKRLQFTILPQNDAPDARDDSGFSIKSGETLKIAPARLLDNDRDVDGDCLVITSVDHAMGGSVTRDSHGAIVFKAATGFSGTASFDYSVSDGHGGVDRATVSIVVKPSRPAHEINGTDRDDRLVSTSANDIFTGKAGLDTFVFRPGGGHDEVRDFQTGEPSYSGKELIDLRGFGFSSYSALKSHIVQDGHDTVIALDTATSIRLDGVSADHLTRDHFLFV